MKPDPRFQRMPRNFWANVRTISQAIGYTARGKKIVKVPSRKEIKTAFDKLGLSIEHIMKEGHFTDFGEKLHDYFVHRAQMLNDYAEPRLMDMEEAKALFEKLYRELKPKCHLPMNKQSGSKKVHAFLTGLINMLIEANAEGHPCDYNPRVLTTITRDGFPLRTLARRIDGAFPSSVNRSRCGKSRNIITPPHSAAGWPTAYMRPFLTGWSFQSCSSTKGSR